MDANEILAKIHSGEILLKPAAQREQEQREFDQRRSDSYQLICEWETDLDVAFLPPDSPEWNRALTALSERYGKEGRFVFGRDGGWLCRWNYLGTKGGEHCFYYPELPSTGLPEHFRVASRGDSKLLSRKEWVCIMEATLAKNKDALLARIDAESPKSAVKTLAIVAAVLLAFLVVFWIVAQGLPTGPGRYDNPPEDDPYYDAPTGSAGGYDY